MLIAVDGSAHSFNAVRYIATTCAPADLAVTLLHVLAKAPETFRHLEKNDFLRKKMQANYARWKKNAKASAQRFLENARDVLFQTGVKQNDVVLVLKEREAGIARDIIEESKRGYDAVVVGRRGLSKLEDLFVGSVSNKIVEGVQHSPVWVIGGEIQSKKMLVAVDGSEHSEKTVAYVGNFAASNGATLTLYHVVRKLRLELLDNTTLRGAEIEADLLAEVEKDTQHLFETYRELLREAGVAVTRISSKYTLHSLTRSGSILREAEEGGYGTIVMGRRGLSKVEEFLMGRVTNKVLQRAEGFAIWIVP